MVLRELNEIGRENFRAHIRALRSGDEPMTLTHSILTDETLSERSELDGELSVANFATRYDMGKHLVDVLSQYELSDLSGREGLWDWIALAWFDQLWDEKVREEINYVISQSHWHRPRHAIYFTWWLVNRYGEDAQYILSKPTSVRGDVAEQLLSVQSYPNYPSFIKTGKELYWDKEALALKPGTSSKGPGSPRRFRAWIGQIELNYDLFAMSSETLIEMLPSEFDKYRLT
jgi:hypothetical protein